MSAVLSDLYTPPHIDDIDRELDRFNDAMESLGYRATHLSLRWGEGKIEVTNEEGQTVGEFFSGTPGYLDDFRRYTDFTLDATSVPRHEIQEAQK